MISHLLGKFKEVIFQSGIQLFIEKMGHVHYDTQKQNHIKGSAFGGLRNEAKIIILL